MTLDNYVMKKLDQLREVYQEYGDYMWQEFQHQSFMPSDQCMLAIALDQKIEQMQSLMENSRRGR